ncbi:MAG TPA: zinc ribbon domain-containing protein [Dehalococcoidia bacterium]|nr:zinc ribbon domain-containing protein [Dehalococcoidia bacterium]
MPIYQYLCPRCNLKFELRQSFSDESMAACPECQNGARRLFSPVPIIFKGPGFYTTDSRNSKTGDSDKQQKSKEENPSRQEKEAED